MKISDGLKLKGKWVEIPDCSRDDLPELFETLGFKSGVEIGTYKGIYTETLAKSNLRVYTVDPWLSYSDYPYFSSRPTQTEPNFRNQNEMDSQYEEARRRLEKYPNVTIIRKTSMEALNDFDDNSIDFVYIDGNHTFKYVAEDICGWIKKVKSGGIVAGHDYIYANPKDFHVRHVVDAYVQAHAIQKFWVLGRKKRLDGEKRDDWRSWMFFKDIYNEK